MEHLQPSKSPTKRRTRSVTIATLRGGNKSLSLAKAGAGATVTPTLGRPVGESLRILVKYTLIIFLTLVSFAVDGPVSWWGFEELTIALQRVSGQAWNASADAKWMFWIFVTVVSTLSLAHFTLNWREYGRGWRGMVRGFCFIALILVPSQLWDFVDSTAGIYGLFQPIDLTALNIPLLYISIAGAIFGSFVAPTFALLLTREGHTTHATDTAKGNARDRA
jgi:hypothetical protein